MNCREIHLKGITYLSFRRLEKYENMYFYFKNTRRLFVMLVLFKKLTLSDIYMVFYFILSL